MPNYVLYVNSTNQQKNLNIYYIWMHIYYIYDLFLMVATMRHLCLYYTENLGLNIKECLKAHYMLLLHMINEMGKRKLPICSLAK